MRGGRGRERGEGRRERKRETYKKTILIADTLLCSCRFLGFVNSIGTAFEAPTLATGLGGYIAQVYYINFNNYTILLALAFFFVATATIKRCLREEPGHESR